MTTGGDSAADRCAFSDCPEPPYDNGLCRGHLSQQLAGRFLSPLRPVGRAPTFEDELRRALSMLRHHAPTALALFARPDTTADVDLLAQAIAITGGRPLAAAAASIMWPRLDELDR